MSSLTKNYRQLRLLANMFDSVSLKSKTELLHNISKIKLPNTKILAEYQHLLLFLAAHAHNKSFVNSVNKEMERVAISIKKLSKKIKSQLENTGLPFTSTTASLTHDLLCILNANSSLHLRFNSLDEETLELNNLLSFTLPEIEKEYTSAGYDQDELLETLGIKEKDKLNFLLNEISKLNSVPFIKDFLVDKINLYVSFEPITKFHSKLFNKINNNNFFFHSDILKKFDHFSLLNSTLPQPVLLNEVETNKMIEVMQTSLWLLERETDPCTFIDKNSLRYFELERGISVAIFGMIPERQLSVESYVGYTLFKNGYPCAYGGAWVFGSRALFGINIFEQFRGGESGYVLMQLLRTYKQVFKLNYFEVEPYQYGLENPEGIESGAFWFYYRYGFRPLDKTLNILAASESDKIKTKKNYRSSKKTLLRFTESNIGLQLAEKKAKPISEIRVQITNAITTKFNGDRKNAIRTAVKNLSQKISIQQDLNIVEMNTLNDFALITECLKLNNVEVLNTIPSLVKFKSTDLYAYNTLLRKFQVLIEN